MNFESWNDTPAPPQKNIRKKDKIVHLSIGRDKTEKVDVRGCSGTEGAGKMPAVLNAGQRPALITAE